MSEQPVRYRFVGPPDTYIDGVPARDLTEEDWQALNDEQQAAVEASALYERVGGGEEA